MRIRMARYAGRRRCSSSCVRLIQSIVHSTFPASVRGGVGYATRWPNDRDQMRSPQFLIAERLLEFCAECSESSDLDGPTVFSTFLSQPRVIGPLRAVAADPHGWIENSVISTSIVCARFVLKSWERLYPDDRRPCTAIEAAEQWSMCPCDSCAEIAAQVSGQASAAALSVWHSTSDMRAPWAARTAAWAADGPKYKWQSFAAISGALKVVGPLVIQKMVEAELTRHGGQHLLRSPSQGL